MQLIIIGLNYNSCSLPIREKLAFTLSDAKKVINFLTQSNSISEAAVISTCNRTEIYLSAKSIYPVLKYIYKYHKIKLSFLKKMTYVLFKQDAIRHLMRVASGADSMIVGESQILGQLKLSYKLSKSIGGVGKNLDRLFQATFATAKKVRQRTELGRNSVSLANLAVQFASKIFTDIKSTKVLLVGLGEIGVTTLKYLSSQGIKEIYVANRSNKNLLDLRAAGVNLDIKNTLELSSIPEYLEKVDIVITSTSSTLPIIGKGMVERAIKKRKHKIMCMIDLSVPRNIEPEVKNLSDVYLYDIDSIKKQAIENKNTKKNAIINAEDIITKDAANFKNWILAQDNINTVVALKNSFEKIKLDILSNSMRELDLGRDPKEIMHKMANLITNKLLHSPIRLTRQASFENDEETLKFCKRFFSIE